MEIPGVVNIDPISYWDWRKNRGNHTFQHDSIITSSIFDVIDQIIPTHNGFERFRELGISFTGTKTERIRKIRNTIYRLFFNPIESLCNSINAFSASLESEDRVGFQVRMGGNLAFTHEKKVFLNESDISSFFLQLEKVKTAIRNRKKAEPQFSLFVSTDSYIALETIQKELGNVVRTAPDIQRGHSSSNQLSRSKVSPTNILRGTFFDLFVLKDCNILISTDYSSFGNLAFEMGLENPYLFEPRGTMGKCTVYNRPPKARVQYRISHQKKLAVCSPSHFRSCFAIVGRSPKRFGR